MKFANELSKLLTNKYFLYFIVFLSVTNVLGYLVNNKIHAVIFFALVSFLMANFSKNMVVILLVALVSTNLLMANKTMREGMEQMEKGEDDMEGQEMEEKDMDDQDNDEADEENYTNMGATKPVKKDDRKNDKKKAKKIVKRNDKKKEPVPAEPVKKAETFGNKHASQLKNAAPVDGDEDSRIDYASTLEGAYDNLDKILGSEGINKLTGDTQKLMAQQQKLFDSMQNMAPMIQNAKEMLSGFDMKGLGDLANMAKGLQSQPAPVIPK
jgi:hypothetical protein